MCGEEVEITWTHTNPLAPSVREMAPAARHETLNDHWNGWNFWKIVGFRKCSLFNLHDLLLFLVKEIILQNVFKKPFS